MEKHVTSPGFMRRRTFWLLAAVLILLVATTFTSVLVQRVYAQTLVPRPDHVVIVMEENHTYAQIMQSDDAGYIQSLARQGASFTNSHAITHPSQPNYLALFSGSTQGLTDDSCPHTFSSANLGSELLAAHFSFGAYSEDLPNTGSTVCTAGAGSPLLPEYARKHEPWADFSNVPASANMPWSNFPQDYSKLPTVSFVVPDQYDDMHFGILGTPLHEIAMGNDWLQQNIDGYAQWARTHNSLLIVTWDENDNSAGNQIPTIFVGQKVKVGQYNESINHYNVLRTLEDMYGLPYANESAHVSPITDAWQ